MTTNEQDTSQITVCTRCKRTPDWSGSVSRCRYDAAGKHSWWIGLRKDWFANNFYPSRPWNR